MVGLEGRGCGHGLIVNGLVLASSVDGDALRS
jgi:hypothetical protein